MPRWLYRTLSYFMWLCFWVACGAMATVGVALLVLAGVIKW